MEEIKFRVWDKTRKVMYKKEILNESELSKDVISSLIDEAIRRDEQRRDEQKRAGKFRVSSSGRCYHMRIWEKQGIPYSDPPSSRTLRVFAIGSALHDWIQDRLQERHVLLLREFELEDEFRIGHIDAVVRSGSKLILYDFKTVHSKKFFYLSNEIDIQYFMQAYTYYLMQKETLGLNISDVRICYISRDDMLLKEVSVLDMPTIDEMVKRDWNEILEVERGKTWVGPKMDWECDYCFYKTKCKNEIGNIYEIL